MKGAFAKKVGMTHFYSDGRMIPATKLVIDSIVIGHKTLGKHGYSAEQHGFGKKSNVKKPQAFLKDFNKGYIGEIRVNNDDDLVEINSNIKAESFSINDSISIRGKTKGRGFTGVMKRWNFSGNNASHGASLSHRSMGSSSSAQDPGKVFKGKKMAGHYGNENVCVKTIVVGIDSENNFLLVKGSVPGNRGSYVKVEKI